METRTVEQVESWSTRSFADGFAGLRELSDNEFSGAVRAGGAWLFMLNGRIIGVYEGSLDDFEGADGTAYAAPHPSLPLLFSMREQGGDERAKYYTNDTPLKEVDSTLTDGKFTGYVELSENVLSGDYYVAYYGGRSMSVAFVGASEQVVTGDEAFERAADEVGIYEVRDVDFEVVDVPEPEGADDADPDAGTPSGDGADESAGGAGEPATSSSGAADRTDPPTETGGGSSGRAGRTANQSSPGGQSSAGGQSSTGEQPSTGGQSPAASQSSADGVTGTTADPEASSTPDTERGQSTTDAIRQPEAENDSTASQSPPVEPATANDTTAEDAAGKNATTEDAATENAADASAGAATESTPPQSDTATKSSTDTASPEAARSQTASSETARNTATSANATRSDATDRAESVEAESDDSADESDAFSEEKEWREATTIPSLDPDRSEGPETSTSPKNASSGATATGATGGGRTSTEKASSGAASTGTASTGTASTGTGSGESERSRADAGASEGSKSRTTDGASTNRQSRERTANSSGTGSKSASGSASSGTASSGSAGSKPSSSGSPGSGSTGSGSGGDSSEEAKARVRKLRSKLQQRKQQVEQLKERLSTAESERNEFERERDALRQEVERLEARLESASSAGSSSSGRQLSSTQAFDGTNLFVRYRSKGKATLEEAAKGDADPEDVNANLQLEHHTQFEADDASVEGRSFEEFLTGSFEHRFVSWIIEELLYEIRETGHRSSLQDLYEAIPKIDRVDLHGSVSAGDDEEGTRKESFDVIMRDRMGNPLLVADLNDSRDPTTGDMMGSLVDAATGVAEAHDELAGAFQVTESFFEPEALETAETATSGGFLSREKRESFVKLSRKRGYHLGLVESRSGGFHLNVPEL